ncbi:MAG: hypothetical protein ACE361_17305 [Aureliella sp.]
MAISSENLIDDVGNVEQTLRDRLPALLTSFDAEVGILWIRTPNGQLRWAASQGIEVDDIPEQSVFVRDLLWNAEETIELGCCQIYNACDENAFKTLSYADYSAVEQTMCEPGNSSDVGERRQKTDERTCDGTDRKIKELVCNNAQLLMPIELPGVLALYCVFVKSAPKFTCGIRIFQLDNAIDALLADSLAPTTISLSRGW